jgi:hypothetical protein
LYIPIFKFFDSRREDRRFWTPSVCIYLHIKNFISIS